MHWQVDREPLTATKLSPLSVARAFASIVCTVSHAVTESGSSQDLGAAGRAIQQDAARRAHAHAHEGLGVQQRPLRRLPAGQSWPGRWLTRWQMLGLKQVTTVLACPAAVAKKYRSCCLMWCWPPTSLQRTLGTSTTTSRMALGRTCSDWPCETRRRQQRRNHHNARHKGSWGTHHTQGRAKVGCRDHKAVWRRGGGNTALEGKQPSLLSIRWG